jgi:Tol biopolymer transport system component
MQIFAADPSGRGPVGQVTFARPGGACYSPTACGFTRPLPSPDGTQLAYVSGGGIDYAHQVQMLYLARGDGTGARALGQAGTAAWSPDSQRFAYSVEDGTHVLSGGHDRVVFGPGAVFLRYSPDGRTLAIRKGATVYLLRRGHSHAVAEQAMAGFAWSPDGRSLAYPNSQGIALVTLPGGQSRLVYTATQSEREELWRAEVAFSPSGRYLAFALGVIRILDLRSGHVLLVRASGHDISWLPDGRLLYVAGSEDAAGDEIATGDVQTVTPHGHISTVIAAAKPYGGQIVAAAWTTAARPSTTSRRSRSTASSPEAPSRNSPPTAPALPSSPVAASPSGSRRRMPSPRWQASATASEVQAATSSTHLD